jgi:TolB protein
LIAYGSNNGIFVMNGDGTNKRNITSGSVAGAIRPRWSPDGKAIVFEIAATYSSIYRIEADGTGYRNLTEGDAGTDGDPHWSPDGTHIVFARSTRHQWDVYVRTSDGEKLVHLTDTRRPTWEIAPSWSPARR